MYVIDSRHKTNRVSIDSDDGLSHIRRQAIIWTNGGILLIGPLGTHLGTHSEIEIKMYTFSFRKVHLKKSSGKWCVFCHGLNVLNFILSQRPQWLKQVNTAGVLLFNIRSVGIIELWLIIHNFSIVCEYKSWLRIPNGELDIYDICF